MTTDSKNLAYETESKVDMAKLREAAQKVFAYESSASRKDSADTHVAKHRKKKSPERH